MNTEEENLKILRLWNIGRIAIIAVALSFINIALLIQFGYQVLYGIGAGLIVMITIISSMAWDLEHKKF